MVKHIPRAAKEFSDYTSIHGIGRISGSSHPFQKIIWVLAVCASFGMGIFQIYRLQGQWQSEQTSTSIEVIHGKIEFPDVSFCNLNPLKFSQVQLRDELFQIIDETASSLNILLESFPKYDPTLNHVYDAPIDLGGNAISGARSLFYVRMANVSNIDPLSQEKERFVVSCTYRGIKCETSIIKTFRDGVYGNCYVLKPEATNKFIDSPGPVGGLQLTLNIDQDEYLPFLTGSAGIVMDISFPGNKAVFNRDGILLSPGFETNVALETVETERLSGETKKCDETSKHGSIAACIENCMGIYARNFIGCAHDVAFVTNSIGLCQSAEDVEFSKTLRTTSDVAFYCPYCKMPCRETVYERSISMSRWPTISNVPILLKELEAKNINTSGITDVNSVAEDFAKINVYFTSLSTTFIKEEFAYTDENFVSDIGGQLGLWAGISVLSLAEVLELLFLFACGCLQNRNRQQSVGIDDEKRNI